MTSRVYNLTPAPHVDLLACLVALMCALGWAGGQNSAAAQDLSPQEAQAFLDKTLAEKLEENGVVGAAGAIIKDGVVIAASGAGLADIAAQRRVDPQTTVFRVGSMTKPVTATAVMQLVERGLLDLDADINDYVDFAVPGGFGKTVTLRRLLSHTAGYSDVYSLIFMRDDTHLLPLEDFVKDYQPDVIFEPGQVAAYSNYSLSLAGYIVQKVSGQSYDDYVRDNIFLPLGMRTASTHQPPQLPKDIALPNGYFEDRTLGPLEVIGQGPAGSLTTTVMDYARFVAALQQSGSLGGAQILTPQSVAEMMTLQSTDPGSKANGEGFGLSWFLAGTQPGARLAAHGGDTVLFHSLSKIYLDVPYAIVVAQNSEVRPVAGAVTRAFEELLGLPKPQDRPAQPDAADDAAVAGQYFGTRHSGHSVVTIGKLLRGFMKVSALPDGGIAIEGRGTYKRVAPLTYQSTKNPGQIMQFFRDDSGTIFQTSGNHQRASWYETPGFVTGLAGFAFPALFIGFIWSVWRLYRATKTGASGAAPAWRATALMSAALLIGIGLFARQMMGIQDDIFSMTPDRHLPLRLAQAALLVGLAALVFAAVRWWSAAQGETPIQRLAACLFVLAGAAAGWIVISWNFLALSLHY